MGETVKRFRISHWLMRRPVTTGFLTFAGLALVVVFITVQRNQLHRENQIREMQSILNVVKRNVLQTMQNGYTTALTLALTINDSGEPENFDSVAAKLIDFNSDFQAVQLVPKGIIKYMYPVKGNEGAIGIDIFKVSEDHARQAREAIRTRKIYFTGPIRLRQGGIGIVGRLPVFKNNRFWGFSAVVIHLNIFLRQAGISNLENDNFYFQFSKWDKTTKQEEFFLDGPTDLSKMQYESVSFPDENWKVYLISRNNAVELAPVIFSLIFGLSLVLLCSILITRSLKNHVQLQRLADAQASRLRDTEIKFKTIFEEAPIGIAVVSQDSGTFLQVNKKLCALLGYPEQELLHLNIGDVVLSDGPPASDDHFSDELEYERTNQQRYLTKAQQIKWANLVESPLADPNEGSNRDTIVIIQDVTDLNQSIELIREKNKRLLNFSYIVSHNLRSHTSNIQAIVNLIEHSETEAEQKEMIGMLKVVSDSLNETMINLNKVVDIQTSLEVIIKPLDLYRYIENTFAILSDQIKAKEAQIENQVPEGLLVNFNPAYLESILLNFIFNAIRYSHPGRKPLIQLKSGHIDGGVVLSVSDNGVGIDLEKNGRELFGMYKTFSGNPESKGIGLFISKNQIDALGGHVTVESTLGKGTTFHIFFKD